MPEHVKVPAVPPRIQYLADGVQAAFPFPFPIFATEDLRVLLDAAPQETGFAVDGAGATAGGAVVFDAPPAAGVRVTLSRRLAIERVTDFLESGPLTARALNNELDQLAAVAQQLADDQSRMLRYPESDAPAAAVLPSRDLRAGRALVFDAGGAPTVAPVVDGEALATFVPPGAGAVARPIGSKLADMLSVRDFGAVGDGVADDTLAIQAALAAAWEVVIPPGTYRVTQTIVLRHGRTLRGAGEASVLRMAGEAADLVEMPEGYARLRDLRLEGGLAGVRLRGRLAPCVQNAIEDVGIWDARHGLVLDGHASPNRPCYWNNVSRVLVARPKAHGVWLRRTGAGDTPNANRFHMLRVYSLGHAIDGDGIRIDAGRFNNAFVDCEVNIGTTAQACVRVGPETDKTLFVNLYTETIAAIPNVVLEAGSVETAVVNLLSASAGPAIQDLSGGRFTAVNAGFPEKNRLERTRIRELVVEALRYDTEFVEPPAGGLVEPDLSSSCYLVSSFGGAVEFRLPNADAANGHAVTVKKTDLSANPVTVTEDGGPGPDHRPIVLSSRYDMVTVVSSGDAWWVVAHNLMPSNSAFHEGPTLVVPDTARAVHLVSAWAAPVEVRLPAPSAAQAVGRTLAVKKADAGGNAVLVTSAAGTGPDGEAIALSAFGHAVTVFSDGAQWRVLARNP